MTVRDTLVALFLVIIVAVSFGCASTSDQERSGEYVDDSLVTAKVKAAIFRSRGLKVYEIEVETFRGVVQLSGFIDSKEAGTHAVGVAQGVAGVKSVQDNMVMR